MPTSLCERVKVIGRVSRVFGGRFPADCFVIEADATLELMTRLEFWLP